MTMKEPAVESKRTDEIDIESGPAEEPVVDKDRAETTTSLASSSRAFREKYLAGFKSKSAQKACSTLLFGLFIFLWLFFLVWIPAYWVASDKFTTLNGTNATLPEPITQVMHQTCSENANFSFAEYNLGYELVRLNHYSTAGEDPNATISLDILRNENDDNEYVVLNKDQDCVVKPLSHEEVSTCMDNRWLLTFGHSNPGVLTAGIIKLMLELGIEMKDSKYYFEESGGFDFWESYEVGFWLDEALVGKQEALACTKFDDCKNLSWSDSRKLSIVTRESVFRVGEIKNKFMALKSEGFKSERPLPDVFLMTGEWEKQAIIHQKTTDSETAFWRDHETEKLADEQGIPMQEIYKGHMEELLTYLGSEWPELSSVYLSTDFSNAMDLSKEWFDRPGWPTVNLYLEKPHGSQENEMIARGHFTQRAVLLDGMAILDGLCATGGTRQDFLNQRLSTQRPESFSDANFLPKCNLQNSNDPPYYEDSAAYATSLCHGNDFIDYIINPVLETTQESIGMARSLQRLEREINQSFQISGSKNRNDSQPNDSDSNADTDKKTTVVVCWTILCVFALTIGAVRTFGYGSKVMKSVKTCFSSCGAFVCKRKGLNSDDATSCQMSKGPDAPGSALNLSVQ